MRNVTEISDDDSGGGYAWYVVAVLTFAYMVSFIDRQILSLLVQPIKRDLGVTDTEIGLLAGFACKFLLGAGSADRAVSRSN